MESTLTPIGGIVATSTRLFRRALDGADAQALRWRPFPGANPMLWIAGHATVVRSGMLRVLGRPHPIAWAPLFARGGTNHDEAQWPGIDAIVAEWDAIAPELEQRLAEFTPGELSADAQGAPSLDGTVLGVIQLAAFHDAYHIGQLGYLRRQADLPRLVG